MAEFRKLVRAVMEQEKIAGRIITLGEASKVASELYKQKGLKKPARKVGGAKGRPRKYQKATEIYIEPSKPLQMSVAPQLTKVKRKPRAKVAKSIAMLIADADYRALNRKPLTKEQKDKKNVMARLKRCAKREAKCAKDKELAKRMGYI